MSKILYVEDNDDNVFMMTTRLRRMGYDVVVARDGVEGVEMAKEAAPDLVLMDLELPELDGWEATRRLKSAPETAAIPIIVLTAHALQDKLERALANGADDYETKPVRLPSLTAKLARLLPNPGT